MADVVSQVRALLANLVLKTVQFRRSFTAGYRPTVLAEGEPFVQFADRLLILGGANGGVQVEMPFDGGGAGGPGIVSGVVNGSGHLILTRSDGTTLDVGYVVGPAGVGTPGAAGSPGRGITNAAINGAGRLILTYSDGATQDVGTVVGGGSGGGPANTDGLPEGASNLYFTVGRVRAAISVTGGLTYNATTGAIGYALPAPTATTLGGVRSLAAAAKTFLTGIGTDGVPTAAQPAFSDLTGTAAPAQLPTPTTTTLGGVKALAATASLWIRSIGADGTPTASQPTFGDISGTASTAQIADKAVSNPKLADVPANTLKGATAAGSPADLTVSQVKGLLAYALSELSGVLQAAQFPALTGAITTAGGSLATSLSAGAVAFSNLASTAIGTAAELFSNAASKLVSVASLWAAQAFVALTDAATIAVDMSTGVNFKVTLAGNRTLGAPTNAKEGQSGVIRIAQDATGSRTLAFATAWDFGSAGTPTLSTGANKIDTISYVVIDTTGPVVRAFFGKSA